MPRPSSLSGGPANTDVPTSSADRSWPVAIRHGLRKGFSTPLPTQSNLGGRAGPGLVSDRASVENSSLKDATSSPVKDLPRSVDYRPSVTRRNGRSTTRIAPRFAARFDTGTGQLRFGCSGARRLPGDCAPAGAEPGFQYSQRLAQENPPQLDRVGSASAPSDSAHVQPQLERAQSATSASGAEPQLERPQLERV